MAVIFMGPRKFLNSSSEKFSKICEFARKPLKDSAICRCINAISLRFHHLSSTSPHSPHPCPHTRKASCFPVYPLSIMVVEDNEVNQRVIRKILSHLGYSTISVANNGREALEIIEKNGLPDIIFMDIQMPILDGIECTRILRKTYDKHWPYIVSITADAFPEDRANCINAGMDAFLTKPIRLEQLQASLETCYSAKVNNCFLQSTASS